MNTATPNIKTFLTERVLKNPTGELSKDEWDKIHILKRDKVVRPVIYIGTGSCGIAAGSFETLKAVREFLQTNEFEAEIAEVGCIGLCSEEPLMDVQLPGKARISFKKVTFDKVDEILRSVVNKSIQTEDVLCQYPSQFLESWANIASQKQLPFFTSQARLLLKDTGWVSPFSIEDYFSRGGYRSFYKTVTSYTSEKVCELVEQSELRGRGGGGYLTGKKWRVALETAGDQKYLICNSEESDPGAFMDRALIEGNPHQLLEGIAISSYAIGANYAFIFIRSDYQRAISILEKAILDARESEILGSNIFGSGFNLNISIRKSPGAFVCGEETALISTLQGKRGIPSPKPPYPAESGLLNRPTIVNNVETLANIPAIIEHGPIWFKSIGSKTSKGTKLFSLSGKIERNGFIEVPMGIHLSTIIHEIGGGIPGHKQLKAVQVGGPLGVAVPASHLETEVGYESMAEVGASIGSGGLVVLDDTICMVNLSKYYMGFLQKESCGKCIPCREGTRRIHEILDSTTRRPREDSSHETLERFKGIVQLETLAQVISQTSLCGLGQHASDPVLSSLRWFREEFEEHIFDRKCAAGVCRQLRTFYIEPEICNGCNVCQKKCPENAIIGVIKHPHFIIEKKCNGCGICMEACKFNAIYIK